MKKTLKVFGIIALVAVIGLAVAACDITEDTTTPIPTADVFRGRYENEGGTAYFAGDGQGKWQFYQYYADYGHIEFFKGAYSLSGNTVNLTITDVHMPKFGDGGDVSFEWTSYSALTAQQKENLPLSQTFQGTIQETTLPDGGKKYTFTTGGSIWTDPSTYYSDGSISTP